MANCTYLDRLIEALQVMPSIGPRSASRIAYYLLKHDKEAAISMANSIIDAVTNIKYCKICRNYSDEDICPICKNSKRSQSESLCIVESPSVVNAIEKASCFHGRYFVLHGLISPIDGIGPYELGFDLLKNILETSHIKEILLAISPSIEGEATSSYIVNISKPYNVNIYTIASGIPFGASVDNADEYTIATSINNKIAYKN